MKVLVGVLVGLLVGGATIAGAQVPDECSTAARSLSEVAAYQSDMLGPLPELVDRVATANRPRRVVRVRLRPAVSVAVEPAPAVLSAVAEVQGACDG